MTLKILSEPLSHTKYSNRPENDRIISPVLYAGLYLARFVLPFTEIISIFASYFAVAMNAAIQIESKHTKYDF